MGCCTTRQKPEQLSHIEQLPYESLVLSEECYKITLYSLHVTKSYEKIVKSPSEFSIKLSTLSEEFLSSRLTIEGLHHFFTNPSEIIIKNMKSSIKITLFAHKLNQNTEIGSFLIDTEVFKTYKQFKGNISLMYRCTKTGTISLEICKSLTDNDYMTLSEQKKCFVGSFLPCREYPSQFASIFIPTPKFNTCTIIESPNINSPIVEKIKLIRKKNVSFEFLIESINENSAELVYYACDKLIFFACQSTYSSKIDCLQVLGLLSKFSTDSFICNRALWLLFYLIESSELVSNK